MAKRKTLSKKTRFEVFKRDMFTCQYCGKGAPAVVLHLDHIEPVSRGGTNEIINLVTSCADCNLGKSDRVLGDSAAITKQIDQLKLMAEKTEQIEMMAKWRAGMVSVEAASIQAVEDEINRALAHSGMVCSALYRSSEISVMVKKYNLPEIFEAIDKSNAQYLRGAKDHQTVGKFLTYIPKICYWQKLHRENPTEDGIRHAIAVAMKKGFKIGRSDLYREIKQYLENPDVDVDDVKQAIFATSGIMKFREWMDGFMEGING